MNLPPLGKRIREQRARRGLLLYHMAEALGYGSAELSAIETGKVIPPADFERKVQDYFRRIPETEEGRKQWEAWSKMDLEKLRKESGF